MAAYNPHGLDELSVDDLFKVCKDAFGGAERPYPPPRGKILEGVFFPELTAVKCRVYTGMSRSCRAIQECSFSSVLSV